MLVRLRSMGCPFILCLLFLIFAISFYNPAGKTIFFIRNGYAASIDPQRSTKAAGTRQATYP
jgi:hypothetical protein